MSNLEITENTLAKAVLDIGTMLREHKHAIETVWKQLLADDVVKLSVKAAITFEVAKNGSLRVRPSVTIPGVAIKSESEFYQDDKQGKLFGNGITSVTIESGGKKVVLGEDPAKREETPEYDA